MEQLPRVAVVYIDKPKYDNPIMDGKTITVTNSLQFIDVGLSFGTT